LQLQRFRMIASFYARGLFLSSILRRLLRSDSDRLNWQTWAKLWS
jgi:hypothetical protein